MRMAVPLNFWTSGWLSSCLLAGGVEPYEPLSGQSVPMAGEDAAHFGGRLFVVVSMWTGTSFWGKVGEIGGRFRARVTQCR